MFVAPPQHFKGSIISLLEWFLHSVMSQRYMSTGCKVIANVRLFTMLYLYCMMVEEPLINFIRQLYNHYYRVIHNTDTVIQPLFTLKMPIPQKPPVFLYPAFIHKLTSVFVNVFLCVFTLKCVFVCIFIFGCFSVNKR